MQLGQAPEKGQHANFLQPASVLGRKVNFVQQSDFATSSFTISAGSQINLTATLSGYDNKGDILDFEDEMGVYHYLQIYVDTNLDQAYEYSVGSSLSSGQKKITISPYTPRAGYSPVDGVTYTIRKIYHFENNDVSPHTLYVESLWNYILLT